MTNIRPWHSIRATDRAVYHDDTRCPEGERIDFTYRRRGGGWREPCEHCALLLIESLKTKLLPAR